jgi:hypothetical protein
LDLRNQPIYIYGQQVKEKRRTKWETKFFHFFKSKKRL